MSCSSAYGLHQILHSGISFVWRATDHRAILWPCYIYINTAHYHLWHNSWITWISLLHHFCLSVEKLAQIISCLVLMANFQCLQQIPTDQVTKKTSMTKQITSRHFAHSSKIQKTAKQTCLRLICSQSTSTYSALEVSHFIRYTNLRLIYLLTYLFISNFTQAI